MNQKVPGGDELSHWSLICTIFDPSLCTGGLRPAITNGIFANYGTQRVWGQGLPIGILSAGVVVPLYAKDPVWNYLNSVLKRVMQEWMDGETNFSPKQYVSATEKPVSWNTFKGTPLDYAFKDHIKEDAEQGNPIAEHLVVSEPFKKEPDVMNATGLHGTVDWYDVTTTLGISAHHVTYSDTFGNGRMLSWTQVDAEILMDEGEAPGMSTVARIR